MSLALALVAAFDWRNGLKEFDRALELNPNLAFAYELQAWTVNGLGRFDEAIAKTRKAVELDPLNPVISNEFELLHVLGRPIRRCDRASQKDAGNGSEFNDQPRFVRPLFP